jgi:hypothetical protein
MAKQIEVTDETYLRWRKSHDALRVDQAKSAGGPQPSTNRHAQRSVIACVESISRAVSASLLGITGSCPSFV